MPAAQITGNVTCPIGRANNNSASASTVHVHLSATIILNDKRLRLAFGTSLACATTGMIASAAVCVSFAPVFPTFFGRRMTATTDTTTMTIAMTIARKLTAGVANPKSIGWAGVDSCVRQLGESHHKSPWFAFMMIGYARINPVHAHWITSERYPSVPNVLATASARDVRFERVILIL